MKIFYVALLVLSLSSCASSVMKDYIGKNINEYILDYGPPVNVLDLS